jgi:uncharacterized membrane protein
MYTNFSLLIFIASPSVKTDTNIAQAPWFIIMMILIAVLILILIIVCFIKRSRGEKYNGKY